MPPQDLLNHPTTPNVLKACKLAEPQTVQDGTPAAASALASALLARPHAQLRLAQKLAPFRPMVERSVEQSVPPAGSGPRDFTTARLNMALMHASAAAGVVGGKGSASLEGFVETDSIPGRKRSRSGHSQVSDRLPYTLVVGGITWRSAAPACGRRLQQHVLTHAI